MEFPDKQLTQSKTISMIPVCLWPFHCPENWMFQWKFYFCIRRMNNVKKKGKMFTGWIIIGFALLFYIAVTWEDLINGDFLTKGNVFMLVIILAGIFRLFTWRNDEKAKQDELGKYIVNKSSVIGYRILTTLLFFLWITDRFLYNHSNEFGNLFLFLGFCISIILLPIIQLFISRYYH